MNTPPAPVHDPADNPAAPVLQRIPLSLRMTVYTLLFLGLVLGVLPFLFYHLDHTLLPQLRVEVGPALRRVGWVWFGLSLLAYLGASIVLTTKGKGPFVEFDPPKELVIDGPYRFVRNPVVCALLSTQFGEALAFSSTGILLMFLIFAFLGHRQVTRLEEPLLRQRYGQAYVDYCTHVPRWIPRLTPYRPQPPGAASPETT
jgi:protein-S-isoprenylcysteine O-methyltransferase Ste14